MKNSKTRKIVVRGSGLLDKLIDKLPIELHIPGGYRFCGPGTKLEQRLARGDIPKNKLDNFCKEHDIKYSQYKDSKNRSEADKILEKQALERFQSSDASLGEKIASLGVSAVMKAKRKLGMGIRKSKPKKGKGMKKKGKKQRKTRQRIIQTPKLGGFLPLLLPILGALGALGGGAAGIAKAVNDAKSNKEQLAELQRHNLAMEAVKKNGKGLYLAPFKKNSR